MRSHQSRFEYLGRSDREEARKIRELIEAWLSNYPVSSRDVLKTRLRSSDDDIHLSAFFELTLHELLLRTGHNVVQVEPELSGTRRSPDFLAEDPSGERFYLEAVVATGQSTAQRAIKNRLVQTIRTIEDVVSPNHFLIVDYEGVPNLPIRQKLLRVRLTAWLQNVPIGDRAKDFDPFIYSEHGLSFRIRAVPRSKAPTDPHQSSVGAISGEASWATPVNNIREAVAKKASRYGSLDAPYIIAVNGLAANHDERHAIDALMASQEGWAGAAAVRKRVVSAVLSVDKLSPWNVAQSRPVLIHNPWANRPFSSHLQVDEFQPNEGQFERIPGNDLAGIFKLPRVGPED